MISTTSTQANNAQIEQITFLLKESLSWLFLIVWLVLSILYVIDTRSLRHKSEATLKDYFEKIAYPGIAIAAMLAAIVITGGSSLMIYGLFFEINILIWMAIYSYLSWRSTRRLR
jgi:tellurite resistance protein TehA-like permease